MFYLPAYMRRALELLNADLKGSDLPDSVIFSRARFLRESLYTVVANIVVFQRNLTEGYANLMAWLRV